MKHRIGLLCASVLLLAASLQAAHLSYVKNITAGMLAVDGSGNVYIANSSTIAKFDPDGNTVYSNQISLIGDPNGMTVDSAGNMIVVGTTNSDAFPATPGVFQPKRSPGTCVTPDMSPRLYPCPDAFIIKFDTGGNLSWASYLGGLGIDAASSVATDPAGNIYVAGSTQSPDFPRVKPFQAAFGGFGDAFLTKVSADGSTIFYSSTLGGQGYNVGYAVAVDSTGNAFLAGEVSSDVPNLPGGGFTSPCTANANHGFIVKVSPLGDTLTLGGCLNYTGHSIVTALTLDRQGNIYIGGTADRYFPVTRGAFNGATSPGYTDFLQKIAPDGSGVIYSSVFQGGEFGIGSIAVDGNGTVYLVGEVESTDFPVAGPAMQPCPGPESQLREFLVHLKADGSSALYSSFDPGTHLALSPDGSLYVGGLSLRKLTALDLPGDSFLSPYCVLNYASMASHLDFGQPGISPGEIVLLWGIGLGPIKPPDPSPVNGLLQTSLGGTEVLFDGVPAPLLFVSSGRIELLAPYRLSSQTTTSIQVRYQDQTTAPVTIPVSPVSAALFRNFDNTSIVLNGDFSINSKAHAAARGSTLVLYMTGAGQTDPPSTDGMIWQTIGGLQQPVSAQLTNYGTAQVVTAAAPVLYAGPVPSVVSGVEQLNLLIPGDLPDSFVTQQFSAGSYVVVQIGPQQVSAQIYIE